MDNEELKVLVNKIMRWSRTNARDFPWRKISSPYGILLAELLLRRTTASAVQRVYDRFLQKYPDLEHLANAPVESLESELKTLGYYRQRAKFIKEIATEMLSKYGAVPNSVESLLSIRQLGLYTAGAVLSLGCDMAVPMVDTNVLRILRRLYGKPISQLQAFELLKNVLPDDFRKFNFALLDFGAMMCRYREPLCDVCPLKDSCVYATGSRTAL